jgi:hypothetical protein
VGPETRASLNAEMSNISTLISSITTSPANSDLSFTSKVVGHFFTYELVTYTVKYDNNKMEPYSIGIKLICPPGVTASLDATADGVNRCDTIVPLFDSLNVKQHSNFATHEVSIRFINSTSLYQVINSNLVLNGKLDLNYNNSVIIPKSETPVSTGPTTGNIYGVPVSTTPTTPVIQNPPTVTPNPPLPPTTVTPPTTPTVNTTCPQSLTINGTTYTISPCSINVTMTDGQGDKNFSTTITAVGASPLFGYSTRGYGVGFPTYGILGGGSGGVNGATTLNLHFKDSVLSADGKSPKTYSGYLPIHIFQGSETGFDNNFLNLNVSATVNPAN